MLKVVRSPRSLLFLLLSAGVLGSGLLLSVTVAMEPPSGGLRGFVYETGTNKPVAGAFVSVYTSDGETKETRAGADGSYSFRSLSTGRASVSAGLRGYQADYVDAVVPDGKSELCGDLLLDPARPELSMYLSGSSTVRTGARRQISLTGTWLEPDAKVTFDIYPYDLLAGRLQEDDGSFQRRQSIEAGQGTPAYSWTRNYRTSERTGSIYAEPATPPIDKPGGYIVVARLGKLTATAEINVTDIALVTKTDRGKTLAWVVELGSGKPIAGAAVESWTKASGQPSFGMSEQATTGQDGSAELANPPARDVSRLIVARSGGSYATTSPYTPDSDRDRNLVYTDRPIYRPGHTVHFKALLGSRRGETARPAPGQQVEFRIEDPEGSTVANIPAVTSGFGTASGSWRCPEEARLGNYSVQAKMGEITGSIGFAVEEYRKPEYAVTVEIPKERYIRGDKLEAKVRASYYFGAPVADAEVSVTVYRSPWYHYRYQNSFEEWFDDQGEEFGYDYGGYGDIVTEKKGRTDASGELMIDLDTSSQETSSRWVIEARVVDLSMREVSASSGVPVVGSAIYIQADPAAYIAVKGEQAVVKASASDWDDKPLSGVELTGSVYLTRWIQDKEVRKRVYSEQVTTGAGGSADFKWTPEDEGNYAIVFEGKDSQGREQTGETYLWVTTESGWAEPYVEGPSMLTLVKDKKVYGPGETAKLLVTSQSKDATVLVTIEGAQLHSHRVLQMQGTSGTIDVPLPAELRPSVQVVCTVVRDGQHYTADERLVISPDDRLLQVSVSSSKARYKPGETAEYTIKTLDSKGRPVRAEASLAVVDESLFALRADSTPEIGRYFWGPQPTEVSTSVSIDDYYYGGLNKFDSSVRKEFPDTAYWNPSVLTGPDGTARVSFRMPDSLTTWRATVRALTGETQVGSAMHKCLVSKDLIVRLAAPRFFRQRDEQKVTLIAHNYTERSKQVEVSLDASGVQAGRETSRRLKLAAGGSARMRVDLKVVSPGTARLVASARAADGSARDALQVDVPVLPHGTPESLDIGGTAGAGGVQFGLPADAISPELRLEVAHSAAGGILSGLEYLADYPWGCIEQTLSRFVPDVIVSSAASSLGIVLPERLQRDLPKMIAEGIGRLREMQVADGGWGWFAEEQADPETSAYALFSVTLAREAGAGVPPEMVSRAAGWAKNYLASSLDYELARASKHRGASKELPRLLERRAFAAAALARADKLDRKYWSALWAKRASMTDFAAACMALTAVDGGFVDAREQAVRLVESRAKRSGSLMFWRGSEMGWTDSGATAMSMLALRRAGRPAAATEPAAYWLMTNRRGGYWRSTRDTSLTVMALVGQLQGVNPGAKRAEVLLNGRRVASVDLPAGLASPPKKLTVGASGLARGKNRIEVRSGSRVFWTASLAYTSPREDSPEAPGFFQVERRLGLAGRPARDGEEQKLRPLRGRVRVGQMVTMEVTVRPKSDAEYALIEVPLPSGFEVISRSDDYFGRSWEISGLEVHDNRVGLYCRYIGREGVKARINLRPEISGSLHVMPARAFCMYSPARAGRSAEARIEVE